MLTDSKEITMQTVTADNKRLENKTSKAISENYRDTQAGICLRLMTYEDTDRIVAWRNSDAVRKNGSGPMWRPEMWCR